MHHFIILVRPKTTVLFVTILLLIGCAPAPTPTPPPTPIVVNTAIAATAMSPAAEATADSPTPAPDTQFGRTYHQADGNRVVFGRGDLANLTPLDIALAGEPTWLVSAPYQDGILWVVTLTDGTVQGFKAAAGTVSSVAISPDTLPAGMPPILRIDNDVPRLLMPDGDFALATHAVPVGDSADLAAIDTAGNVIIEQAGATHTLAVNALPDARILVDENERLLLLTDPTADYAHRVLGDELEAGSMTLIETQPVPRIVRTIMIDSGWVIEGIAPIWADLDGDGAREIIVTRTNASDGAQIVVYAEDGTLLGTGPTVGQGFRWRHQLAVGAFSAENSIELVDVLTPHIGGRVEFYRWDGSQLSIDASVSGYTSHVIATRNLDMAIAADWSGTGRMQLLLPTQPRTELALISFEAGDSASASLLLPVGGRVVTNLSAAALADGQLAIGIGRSDGVLRIWQP